MKKSLQKWKRKLTVRLLHHIAETTQRSTLDEVVRNITAQPGQCFECTEIARRLGIDLEKLSHDPL